MTMFVDVLRWWTEITLQIGCDFGVRFSISINFGVQWWRWELDVVPCNVNDLYALCSRQGRCKIWNHFRKSKKGLHARSQSVRRCLLCRDVWLTWMNGSFKYDGYQQALIIIIIIMVIWDLATDEWLIFSNQNFIFWWCLHCGGFSVRLLSVGWPQFIKSHSAGVMFTCWSINHFGQTTNWKNTARHQPNGRPFTLIITRRQVYNFITKGFPMVHLITYETACFE